MLLTPAGELGMRDTGYFLTVGRTMDAPARRLIVRVTTSLGLTNGGCRIIIVRRVRLFSQNVLVIIQGISIMIGDVQVMGRIGMRIVGITNVQTLHQATIANGARFLFVRYFPAGGILLPAGTVIRSEMLIITALIRDQARMTIVPASKM
jgi:hypothetical protein